MLRTSFHHHPHIIAHTELFNPDLNHNEAFTDAMPAEDVLASHVFRQYPTNISAVGFALHRSGARFGNWPDLWHKLEADKELRIISLRRNNLLARYVSWCLMREWNRSGKGDAYQPPPRIIEAHTLREEFERAETELAEFDRRFAGHPTLRVTYEQLCHDYRASLNRIHAFLGVRAQSVSPHTTQNQSPPLAQLISNFTELGAIFTETRWAWFFRDAHSIRSFSARSSFTISL